MKDAQRAFIVSRIGLADSPERKVADEWLETIVQPVCGSLGIIPERADQISAPGRINDQVARRLLTADVVIADLTGLNSNVMFEIGIRHGLGLPVVQMASLGTDLPFDLTDMRTLFYDPGFNHSRTEKSKDDLAKAIPAAVNVIGSAFVAKAMDVANSTINVEGAWRVEFPAEMKHRREIRLELQQNGELIRGLSTHVKRSEDIYGDPIRTYVQEGRIYNRFIQLIGKSPTAQRLLINSFLLELVRDGQMMEGAVMAYSTVQGGIITSACKCIRS